jgi:Mg2+-importing ATPase
MFKWARPVLPKWLPHGPYHPSAEIHFSPQLQIISSLEVDVALEHMKSQSTGLTDSEANARLHEFGPNTVASDEVHPQLRLLMRSFLNPLVLLLLLLSTSSLLTGDREAALLMFSMVILGLALRFVQESRANTAAAKLRAMISVRATVLRDGLLREEPISQLVPGDVIHLSAGDMIPADVRLLACKDLFLLQAALTGEPFPVEKFAHVENVDRRPALELANLCFLGTSVESGSATALVVTTGLETFLGGMSTSLTEVRAPTAFDRGVTRFTWVMISFMAVMAPLVFLINGLTKGDWKLAFFFALAVAVGLTPEMLPMIVAACLSKGAIAMSKKKVIVKRLNSIQNLGAMDILCTDKTGTLTMDQIILEKHCDVLMNEDDNVLALAFINSHFQTGLKNLMDRAILDHVHLKEQGILNELSKVDEIPFDFSRKLMSVVIKTPDNHHRLICKGAPEEIFKRCASFELGGKVEALDDLITGELIQEFRELSADGFRVLAIAYRDMRPKHAYSKEDETRLVLRGYLAFLDPPKDSARAALSALERDGVAVKVLTGDNELISRKICREVGVPTEHLILGAEIDAMSDDHLTRAAEGATLFARVSPSQKRRIIRSLQASGHVVGFLGDGINDAPALRTADVSISVDTAVDIAKECADAILLEKDLLVLESGVLEGRKVYANILKYVRLGASSSFGNMFSVVGASLFLPFLPMAPLQILTNNLLYDFSQTPIPADEVDPEQIAHPRPWSMRAIFWFIVAIGPCSSIFDYLTFYFLLEVLGCWNSGRVSLFQTGWFVESLLTQTLIFHVIRTPRIPFLQSRASWPLLLTTTLVMIVGICLPFSPLAPALGFTPLPPLYWPFLLLILLGYALLTQAVKTWLIHRRWLTE